MALIMWTWLPPRPYMVKRNIFKYLRLQSQKAARIAAWYVRVVKLVILGWHLATLWQTGKNWQKHLWSWYVKLDISYLQMMILYYFWHCQILHWGLLQSCVSVSGESYCPANQEWRHVLFSKLSGSIYMYHLCNNPIRRIGFIHKWSIDSH